IDGKENEVGAGISCLGQLYGEVIGAGIGEGGGGYDFQPLRAGLFLELLIDSAGVHVIISVDYGDLGTELLICNVISGSNTLVGIREADLEEVVLAFRHCGGGSGRGQAENAVRIMLCCNRLTG